MRSSVLAYQLLHVWTARASCDQLRARPDSATDIVRRYIYVVNESRRCSIFLERSAKRFNVFLEDLNITTSKETLFQARALPG